MALLNRQAILNHINDVKRVSVSVPEWGGEVLVSVMSGKAKDMFEHMVMNSKGLNTENIRAKLVAASVIDEQGNLLFTEKDLEDLGKLSCAALDRVVKVAQELNVLSNADVEDLSKNSSAAQ